MKKTAMILMGMALAASSLWAQDATPGPNKPHRKHTRPPYTGPMKKNPNAKRPMMPFHPKATPGAPAGSNISR